MARRAMIVRKYPAQLRGTDPSSEPFALCHGRGSASVAENRAPDTARIFQRADLDVYGLDLHSFMNALSCSFGIFFALASC